MPHVAVAKWGNRLAVRLPKHLADDLGLMTGTELAMGIEGGRLVASPVRPRVPLAELVKRISSGNRHAAADWGSPVGNAVW